MQEHNVSILEVVNNINQYNSYFSQHKSYTEYFNFYIKYTHLTLLLKFILISVSLKQSLTEHRMSSMIFNQKLLNPIPPEKGSFPLDHEGVCRDLMIKYLRCLWENDYSANNCKAISKSYLGCRMDNNLMVRTDWSDLGFDNDAETKEEQNTKKNTQQTADKKQ
jgi:hypothetical protein